MSILTGKSIESCVNNGDIEISPFNKSQLNSNSYDLRLGRGVKVYTSQVGINDHPLNSKYPITYKNINPQPLDPKKPIETTSITIDDRILLSPGILYLMHVEERVLAKKHVPVLDGKSSIGRIGVTVHITAGFGDIGFDGQYTLEVVVTHSVYLYAGMRIAQVRFHESSGEIEDYKSKGHYVGNNALGAIGSKVHLQMKDDGL